MTPDTSFLGHISQQLVDILLPILASALVALAVMALKKLGISISADNEAKLQYTAKQAVLKVEEVVAAKVASSVDKYAAPVTDKLTMAVATVMTKLPNVTHEEAVDAIHAALPQLGLGAAAGVECLGKAMQTPNQGQ